MAKGISTGRGRPSTKGRRASHMHIERADNGFTAETHFEQPKASASARKAMMPEYEPPQKTVFGDHKALASHVANVFGDGSQEPDGDEGANENA